MSSAWVSRRIIGLLLGPLCFAATLLAPLPEAMAPAALRVAAVALLMAIWWITEAIPIPATALLPIALFPALGVMDSAATTRAYANHLIYLFMGGFLIAVTMERWDLHRRLALHTLRLVGTRSDRIVLGFMLATGGLSMWLSNTATAMMMLPIGMAVAQHALRIRQSGPAGATPSVADSPFAVSIMLGIAYAASIGGVATLIGTPPNAVLAGVVEKLYGARISFAAWMAFGLPLSVVMLLLAWVYLTRIGFRSELPVLPGGRAVIAEELARLGPMRREERYVLAVFACVAIAWVGKGLVDVPQLAAIHDSTVAIAGALALFLIPVDLRAGRFLLDWPTAVRIPWDIILLFGGGFALAEGFQQSALAAWIGEQLTVLEGAGLVSVVLGVAVLAIFLTEVTSNTATATMLLPIMASLAAGAGVHPYAPMVAATVACSYAFMLPVATPPNAVVFASHLLSIPQMARAGVWLNVIGFLLITLFVTVVLPLLWGLDLRHFPVDFPAAGHP